MSALKLRLYRTLLRKASHYDKNPAMKAILKDLNQFQPLSLRALYSPSKQKSFVQLVRTIFRTPPPPPEGIDAELGFNVLRYLNEIDSKFFKQLYPAVAEGVLEDPRSKALTAVPPAAKTTAVAAASSTQSPELRTPFWALPVPVPDHAGTPAAPGSLVPTQSSPVAPYDPLAPGVLLATHPLAEWPFPKCVLLVLEHSPEHVSALILNYPRTSTVGDRNYVFPPSLRREICHVGGPVLSYDMPPVPNYYILHSHRNLPNCKVLLPDEERPVCLSTGEDLAAIGDFIRRQKARPEDFLVFAGSLVMPKQELQQQVEEGFWMPVLASSQFVHSAPRLGRVVWDGLMQACGGEFAHLPLVSAMLERARVAPPP